MRASKKHRVWPRRLSRALTACGLALVAAPALLAGGPGEEGAAEAPAGLRAYLDPETGELTSTPSREQVEALSEKILSEQILSEKILSEEARSKSLERAFSRSSAGLEPFALERGGRGVFLEGRFRSALVARRQADGGLELVCADDGEHASEALAEPPPAVSPRWVEKQWVEK